MFLDNRENRLYCEPWLQVHPVSRLVADNKVAKVEINAARTSSPAAFSFVLHCRRTPPPWWRGFTEAKASTERGKGLWHRVQSSGSTMRRGMASFSRGGAG